MAGKRRRYFVENKRKGEIPGRTKDIEEIINRKGPCLVTLDEEGQRCGASVKDNCHVIPESLVLSKLAESKSGKVLELQWGAQKWINYYRQSNASNPMVLDSPADFEPRKVGIGETFIRWFACHDHDQQFSPIDTDNPDLNDPVVRLSYMYRMALYEADLSRLNTRINSRIGTEFTRHSRKEVMLQWVNTQREFQRWNPLVNSSIKYLGQLWLKSKRGEEVDHDLISCKMLQFQSNLDFAACVCYGTVLHAIVIPERAGRHKLILLHLAEHSEGLKAIKEELIELANASQIDNTYGVIIADNLMRTGGAVAASIESYGRLSDEERHIIQTRVAQNAGVGALLTLFQSTI